MDTLLAGLMKRMNVKSIDSKIAKLAHDLTDWYAIRPTEYNNKTLSTPDALHLATAILYRANEFHTFDEDNGRNSLGLLPLSGNVAGYGLTICKPVAKNPGFDFRKPGKNS